MGLEIGSTTKRSWQSVIIELDTGESFVYSGWGNIIYRDTRRIKSIRYTPPIPEEDIIQYIEYEE
jgi:hypothetical protein